MVQHREHRIVNCGFQSTGYTVIGTADLGAGPGKVKRNLISHNCDFRLDHQILVPSPVIVHIVGERIAAVRQVRDRGPGLPRPICQPLSAERLVCVQPDPVDQLLQLIRAVLVCGQLRPQIAPPLILHLEVQHDQLHHVLIQHSPVVQLDHRDAQALVVDSGPLAGLIGVVARVDHERNEPVLIEDRLEEHNVRKVGATSAVGVVGNENVAVVDILGGKLPGQDLHRPRQGAEMQRDVLGQGEQLALRTENRHRQVLPLLDIGAVPRLGQNDAHLLGD